MKDKHFKEIIEQIEKLNGGNWIHKMSESLKGCHSPYDDICKKLQKIIAQNECEMMSKESAEKVRKALDEQMHFAQEIKNALKQADKMNAAFKKIGKSLKLYDEV